MSNIELFSCGPLATNAILFSCKNTKKAILIDPALGSCELFLKAIEEKEVIAEAILLTHSHWDHLADLAILEKELHLPIYVHPKDRDNVYQPGVDGLPLPIPCQGIKKEVLPLVDGQEFFLGDISITVIHTPGHSPGSVCFYAASEHILISGDTLFKGSMGNVHLPGARMGDMWQSLKKLAKLPPDTSVYPGHGNVTTIGAEDWMDRAESYFG